MLPNPLFWNIHMYGVMIAVGLLGLFGILFFVGKRIGLEARFIDFMFYAGTASVVVGFFSAMLFQSVYNYIEDPTGGFSLNGGSTFLGGLIGGAITFFAAYLIFRKRYKNRLYDMISLLPCCVLVAHAFGRLGCFFAGCCYGIEVSNPALHFFPVSIQIDGVWHFATMFWESAFCILGFLALQLFLKRKPPKGAVACAYMCIYGAWRAIVETFRGDSLMFFETGLKVSQVLSILLVIVGIIGLVLIYTKHKKNEKVNHS